MPDKPLKKPGSSTRYSTPARAESEMLAASCAGDHPRRDDVGGARRAGDTKPIARGEQRIRSSEVTAAEMIGLRQIPAVDAQQRLARLLDESESGGDIDRLGGRQRDPRGTVAPRVHLADHAGGVLGIRLADRPIGVGEREQTADEIQSASRGVEVDRSSGRRRQPEQSRRNAGRAVREARQHTPGADGHPAPVWRAICAAIR